VDEPSHISGFKHPIIWFLDKYRTGLNRPGLIALGLVPVILGAISFIANLLTIGGIRPTPPVDSAMRCALWMIFILALLNLAFVALLQRNGIRLRREKENYATLHREVIEGVREYFAQKRYADDPLPKSEIVRHIKKLLDAFNTHYMRKMHRPKVSATLKYLDSGSNKLVPIRVGGDCAQRNQSPESVTDSHVYQSLCMPGKTKCYIYVMNIQKPTTIDIAALAPNLQEVQTRAQDKYTTFLALPIRTGKNNAVSKDFTSRTDLGMIGFDLKEPYGFGNVSEQEIHYIACFADLISELVVDLADLGSNEHADADSSEQEV
jgi:hypothetical protein